MAGEKQNEQSRTPLAAALVLCAILAIAALSGWYQYFSESDKNQAVAGENADFRLQVQQLQVRIQELTASNQNATASLEQFDRKTGELESVTEQLNQVKSTLEADLQRERQARQQAEAALAELQRELAGLKSSQAELQQELAGLRSSHAELQQELALREDRQSSLKDQISAVNDEREQLLGQLEQAQSKRQQLQEQIALVSGEVRDKEAELLASKNNMEQLSLELVQTRQDQDQLKQQVAQLSEQQIREAQDFAALKQRLESELNESRVQISQLKNRMTVISLTSEVLFSSGSAEIKPAGRKVLSVIASTLKSYPDRIISIEGHTDNVPLARGSFYKSNWQLSAARALAAVDHFREGKLVPPERMRLVGHGEFSPVASNDTAEGRQLNRRIEIRLLPPGETKTGFGAS